MKNIHDPQNILENKSKRFITEVDTSNQDENSKHSDLEIEEDRYKERHHKEERGDVKEKRSREERSENRYSEASQDDRIKMTE